MFRKDIEPRCVYCKNGSYLDEKAVICIHRGVAANEFSCSRFRYDPLKRVPPRAPRIQSEKFDGNDFSL